MTVSGLSTPHLVTHRRDNRVAIIAEDQVTSTVNCPEQIRKLIRKLHVFYIIWKHKI